MSLVLRSVEVSYLVDEEDIEYEMIEEKIEVAPGTNELAEKNRTVLLGNPGCPGCGSLIGLKIALQIIENPVLVSASGFIASVAKYPNSLVNVPFVHAGLNAAATAAAISRYSEKTVLVYAGDGATKIHINSLLDCAKRGENIIYVCYNNQGYSDVGFPYERESSARLFDNYSATASVAYPEDYIKKLKKVSKIQGFRFIDLFAPCPVLSGFDPSNTVEVARLAVETGLWPLYQIKNRKLEITLHPTKTEPLERYLEIQERFKGISEEKLSFLKKTIEKNQRLK